MFAMSLANRTLNFRRDSNYLVADYHVELTVRHDSAPARVVMRDERVRVGTVPETLRRDESIIFQQLLMMTPGIYTVSVVVRDRTSPAYAQAQLVDTVPQFDTPGLGRPLPIYEGTGRADRTGPPALVANPRGTTGYAESARVYVEGYGFAAGTRVAARLVDLDSVELWHDTLTLGEGPLATLQFVINRGVLPPGRAEFQARAVGGGTGVSVPLLVTFSDQWAVKGFDQVVDLLRFFSAQDLVARLKAAPRDQRGAAWRDFYKASDATPATSQNEPLDKYFHRIDVANQRYFEAKDPGWKTDRGEVYITLGEPDQAFEVPGKYSPGLRWEYSSYNVVLAFQDEMGNGQYRLTEQSRADYDRALAEARSAK
jgi:GWxTD domain-containing protein